MKISKKFKIEKTTSSDLTRPQLCNVFIEREGEKSFAVATNGTMLAKVPITLDEGDVAGYLTPLQVSEIRKGGVSVSVQDRVFLEKTERPKQDEIGLFPNYRAVIPDGKNPKFVIGFNPKLLMSIAEAIGATDGVILKVYAEDKAFGIAAIIESSESGEGVLMPMSITHVRS